jgi:hypothetical protein
MNWSNWIRFRWDLTQLPKFDAALPEHYEIGPATAEDETELRKVISSSFVLDPTWNPATQEVMEAIEPWLVRAFTSPTSTARAGQMPTYRRPCDCVLCAGVTACPINRRSMREG